MDDLFDIMGISLFASDGTWCTLKNMPCIPLPSCSRYMEEGRCAHVKGNDTGEDEDEH